MVDWDQHKPDAAVLAVRELLAHVSPKVDVETVAWASYMLALVLDDQKKYAEAIRELEPIASREGLSTYRRSWALYQLSLTMQAAGDKEGAIKAARQAYLFDFHELTPLLTNSASTVFGCQ